MIGSTFNALPEILAAHGRHRPERPALQQGGICWTWGEFAARIDSVAALLAERGVQPGDRVALLSGNRMDAYAVAFGALRAGAVIAPLSPMLSPPQLAAVLADCAAALLFVDPLLLPLAEAAGAAGIIPLPLDLPTAPAGFTPPLSGGTDPATLIYSSGTTGEPKGILHDHRARMDQAAGLAAEFRIDDRARTLLATPLHTNGTWMMALPTLASGGCCLLMERFTPDAAAALLADEAATHMFAVPTMLQAMLQPLGAATAGFPAMEMVVSAGSALSLALKARLSPLLGGKLAELYGLTEGVATILKPHDMATHADSVGRPGCGVEIEIVGEDGQLLPPGETGEIVGRSAGLMRGYYGRPEATQAILWHDARGRAFLRTGDMGHFDSTGFLHIVDRKKDMIISGGLNIFSADLEEVVRGHASVAEVAVIGLADAKWGETPVAVVVPARAEASAEAIAAFANATLAKHQRLSRVILRAEPLPRNLLGKVLKRQLREEYGG
ncbi:class I adenylate-forming enzyme family protein [Sandaracinobacter neustonicus]|uniref:class I adenylate-forming enzyme family protein n=1 Tax=Sandaracinobacter neustonicus TaxID=1715348 RepID=UPI0015E34007|nr:AMP-binding protein [Sandaracinobacter neustonicus]